jgi:hypothetical protein
MDPSSMGRDCVIGMMFVSETRSREVANRRKNLYGEVVEVGGVKKTFPV